MWSDEEQGRILTETEFERVWSWCKQRLSTGRVDSSWLVEEDTQRLDVFVPFETLRAVFQLHYQRKVQSSTAQQRQYWARNASTVLQQAMDGSSTLFEQAEAAGHSPYSAAKLAMAYLFPEGDGRVDVAKFLAAPEVLSNERLRAVSAAPVHTWHPAHLAPCTLF
jgi:hypothetical protein